MPGDGAAAGAGQWLGRVDVGCVVWAGVRAQALLAAAKRCT